MCKSPSLLSFQNLVMYACAKFVTSPAVVCIPLRQIRITVVSAGLLTNSLFSTIKATVTTKGQNVRTSLNFKL